MSIGINLNDDTYFGYPGEKKSIVGLTFEVSGVVAPRTRYEVLASLMEEVGELATEVAIAQGYSKKQFGPDGVIGESIDIITCALDMIWLDVDGRLTPEDMEDLIMRILQKKLAKWKEKKLQTSN